jgi:hypothetical protein
MRLDRHQLADLSTYLDVDFDDNIGKSKWSRKILQEHIKILYCLKTHQFNDELTGNIKFLYALVKSFATT